MPTTSQPCRTSSPRAYHCTTSSGVTWPSSSQKVAASRPRDRAGGRSRGPRPPRAGATAPQRVLEGERGAEPLDVALVVEQKEVAVLVELDAVHRLELVERAQRDADVQLVGELRPEAAGRLARRAGREHVPLDEHDASIPSRRRCQATLAPMAPPPTTTLRPCRARPHPKMITTRKRGVSIGGRRSLRDHSDAAQDHVVGAVLSGAGRRCSPH